MEAETGRGMGLFGTGDSCLDLAWREMTDSRRIIPWPVGAAENAIDPAGQYRPAI